MQTQVYSIDEIREIVAPIAKQHGVDKVFLFGSYARGDATPASDVDLCVDAPKLRGLFALGGLYADLEDALKKSIDVVTTGSLKYNKDKAFLENLRKDRVLLYELPNRDAQILAHILEYCNRIEKTLSRFGRNFDIFLEDQDYMDSVSMNLLQIGELAGKFSDAYVQETKPQMDWRAIKNMRNMFAHDYGSMDKDRIWQTATEDVPALKAYCERALTEDF